MKIKEIISVLEDWAPPVYQEKYDNSGLLTPDFGGDIDTALIALDITMEVIQEAIEHNIKLIIGHHPLIFSPLKRISGSNSTEKILIKCIKHDIAIYALHTNLDNVHTGVNAKIMNLIGASFDRVIVPKKSMYSKLVCFCPEGFKDKVLEAMFDAGAGHIGDYERCSFFTNGTGRFKGNENSEPFVGEPLKDHFEDECRLETIVPNHQLDKVISAMFEVHPYQEVAYDVFSLENDNFFLGAGAIGNLKEEISENEFLLLLKEKFKVSCIRHTNLLGKKIKRVAVCGGSGAFLLKNAMTLGADILVSADFKYHDFFEVENSMVVADIGHYESEQFTSDLILEYLSEKFPKFAVLRSKVNTNPINYFV